jgi:hypothetical protein
MAYIWQLQEYLWLCWPIRYDNATIWEKGEHISDRKAALKFLDAVKREVRVTYKAVALLLKAAIEERPPTAPLPPRFHIGNMATFIVDSNMEAWDDDLNIPAGTQMKVYHLHGAPPPPTSTTLHTPVSCGAQPKQRDDTTAISTITTDLNPIMQGYSQQCHQVNQMYRCQGNQQKCLGKVLELLRDSANIARICAS